MKRNVGNMGEKQFSSLCSAVGITANKSEIDDKGWDYIVEFPLEFTSGYTDLIKSPIKCLVQVKSTDDKKYSSWSIKLSNLLYFCKTPLPTFFCLIKFDGKDSPQSISLLHVDKTLIEYILKTAREYNVTNKKIDNPKKSICFRKEHILEDISGKALKKAIENYIPMGMDEYSKSKINLINTIGYEDGNFHISITARPSELRDGILGIISKIAVKDFQLFDKRFGIISKEPKISASDTEFQIIPESQGEITLMFSQEEYGNGVKIKFQKYISNLDEHLPFEQRKFRLKSNFFEMILQPSNTNLIFSIGDENQSFNIEELNRNYDLLKMLVSGQFVYISFFHNNEIIQVSSIPPVFYNSELDDNLTRFDIAHKYYKILEKYNLHNEIAINFKTLYKNSNNINHFYTIAISNYKIRYSIVFSELLPINDNDDSYQNGLSGKVAGVISIDTIIENHKLLCLFAIIADEIEINAEGSYTLVSEKTGYHKFLMFSASKYISEEVIDKEFDKIMDKISSDGITPIRVKLNS